ncbi:hypothetical protein D3C78_1779230 [compost metagenome]
MSQVDQADAAQFTAGRLAQGDGLDFRLTANNGRVEGDGLFVEVLGRLGLFGGLHGVAPWCWGDRWHKYQQRLVLDAQGLAVLFELVLAVNDIDEVE